jgi:hypothetical protein
LEIAGLKEWTKGCMSVVDRSCFSYQVAAGSTTSEWRVWLVMRKSRVSIRSTFPIGASSLHRTSRGRRCSGVSSSVAAESTPSRWRKKYWSPFAEEPSVFARQIDQIFGWFCGASGSSAAKLIPPFLSWSTRYGMVSSPASAARSATSRELMSNCG